MILFSTPTPTPNPFGLFFKQAPGRRGRWAVGGAAGCSAAGGARVAGLHLHPPDGHQPAQERREAQVPFGGPRHPCWHLCGPHVSPRLQLGPNGLPTGRGQAAQGGCSITYTVLIQYKTNPFLLFHIQNQSLTTLIIRHRTWTTGPSMCSPWRRQPAARWSSTWPMSSSTATARFTSSRLRREFWRRSCIAWRRATAGIGIRIITICTPWTWCRRSTTACATRVWWTGWRTWRSLPRCWPPCSTITSTPAPPITSMWCPVRRRHCCTTIGLCWRIIMPAPVSGCCARMSTTYCRICRARSSVNCAAWLSKWYSAPIWPITFSRWRPCASCWRSRRRPLTSRRCCPWFSTAATSRIRPSSGASIIAGRCYCWRSSSARVTSRRSWVCPSVRCVIATIRWWPSLRSVSSISSWSPAWASCPTCWSSYWRQLRRWTSPSPPLWWSTRRPLTPRQTRRSSYPIRESRPAWTSHGIIAPRPRPPPPSASHARVSPAPPPPSSTYPSRGSPVWWRTSGYGRSRPSKVSSLHWGKFKVKNSNWRDIREMPMPCVVLSVVRFHYHINCLATRPLFVVTFRALIEFDMSFALICRLPMGIYYSCINLLTQSW